MTIQKSYVLLLVGMCLISNELRAASACGNPESNGNNKKMVLVSIRNGVPGTPCLEQQAQVRPYHGDNITNGTWDTAFLVASPPAGNAARVIDASSGSCALRDDGTTVDEDFVGGSQVYNGHIMVLVNNTEALPARIVPAAYMKGNLPSKGTKYQKLYPMTAIAGAANSADNVCIMRQEDIGLEQAFCRYCTSVGIGN